MTKNEFWTLTISSDEWKNPLVINFANPPRRDEFLHVVSHTPWMSHAYSDDLLPIVVANPWPSVSICHKAASQDLIDPETGAEFGHIDIGRDYYYCNVGVDRFLYLKADIIERATSRLSDRAEAFLCVNMNSNSIVERAGSLINAGHEQDAAMLHIVNMVLYEKGFRKTKPALRKDEA